MAVGKALNVPIGARAPVYVTPAAAGTVEKFPFPLPKLTACQSLAALFLLGLAVPVKYLTRSCSEDKIQLLKDVGLICNCEHDTSLLFAVVSIMPIDLGCDSDAFDVRKTLYVVTDWHPRVLNTIRICGEGPSSPSSDEEAVMYIGPDSLALIQHWILHPNLQVVDTMLDVCSGSGVLAMACLAVEKCQAAVCVDISARALRFTAFSAALNGLSSALSLVQGDLLKGTGRPFVETGTGAQPDMPTKALTRILLNMLRKREFASDYGMITANPPFLPVPDAAFGSTVADRHGLFSAGGSSGENVLSAVLALSNQILKPDGFMAVVSEFFFRNGNPDGVSETTAVLRRLQSYWINRDLSNSSDDNHSSNGILFTNEYSIPAVTYAVRRADSAQEAIVWKHHLDVENITACSPGLLYVRKQRAPDSSESGFAWTHVAVPRSERGSVWTPFNSVSRNFTYAVSRVHFEMID